MNHDVSHCLDYKKGECPEDCYRAKVTQEYFKLKAAGKINFPTSWTHFKGTEYCPKGDADEA